MIYIVAKELLPINFPTKPILLILYIDNACLTTYLPFPAHLERSHRTDDDEFYRLRALRLHSEKHLLEEALHFIYCCNNVREHFSLDYSTPFAHLKQQYPDIYDNIRFFQPFILDDVSVKLGPWSGYNLLVLYQICSVNPNS